LLDQPLPDEGPHSFVDTAAGEDHLRVIADLLRERGYVIRIDAEAMPADKTGLEPQEVPLRPRGTEHVRRADADAIADERQLVHQRDVEVSLDVFDGLRR